MCPLLYCNVLQCSQSQGNSLSLIDLATIANLHAIQSKALDNDAVPCLQGVKSAEGAAPAALQPGDLEDREAFSSKVACRIMLHWL